MSTPRRRLHGVGTLPIQYRTCQITRVQDATDDKPALYEVAVSTEAEVERWFGIEVLSHDKGAVDMARLKRGAAVLVDHRGDQVGVVEDSRVDSDKVLRASIRFSRGARGREVEQDVADRIRQGISVGYFIKKAKLVETRDGGVDVWLVTRWQPAEVSIVSVPADINAGVGRGQDAGYESPLELEHPKENRAMKKVRDERGTIIEVPDDDPRPRVEATEVTAEPEDKRADRIRELCRTAGFAEAQPASEQVISAMSAKERRQYSYFNAIRGCVNHSLSGLEKRVSDAIAAKWPSAAPRMGEVIVPLDLRTDEERMEALAFEVSGLGRRTMTGIDVGKGTELVQQQYGALIELLRNRSILATAGATIMPGLTGPVQFPKVTAGATVEWAAENPAAATTASDLSFGLMNMSQKTLRGLVLMTRQLLAQSAIDMEARTRLELATAHALRIDKTGLHGKGTGGEPHGIYKFSGVNAVAMGGVPTLALLKDMIVAVAADNADMGTLRFITTPEMAGVLRTKPEHDTAAMGNWLWQGTIRDGTVMGYNAHSTNQVSKLMSGSEDTGGTEHGIAYGNWAELIIGLFGALELLPDPYTSADKQIIKVHTFQMCDLGVLHPESFCKATGATLS